MRKFAQLLEHPALWRADQLARVRTPSLPTGFARLDRELPGGGWPTGALTEVLVAKQGIGETSLLLPALARLSMENAWQAWIAPPHLPYAPALATHGIDLSRLIVVRPRVTGQDVLWSIEQALRTGSCGAVLAWIAGRSRVNYAALRRLQLAAEASEVLAVMLRPASAAHEPSPAALRLAVEPATHGRIAVHVLKRRGSVAAAPVHLDLKRLHAVDRHQPAPHRARSVPAGDSRQSFVS